MSDAPARVGSSAWHKTRKKRLVVDGNKCVNCGDSEEDANRLEVHHITPVAEGGGNELSNLITLCERCHKHIHRLGSGEEYPPELLLGADLPPRKTAVEATQRNSGGFTRRRPADWMVGADDRVLEVIRSEGNMTPIALSRKGEIERIEIGRSYAGERCRELVRYGLLERLDRGLYGITREGVDYLEAELDASELELSSNV